MNGAVENDERLPPPRSVKLAGDKFNTFLQRSNFGHGLPADVFI